MSVVHPVRNVLCCGRSGHSRYCFSFVVIRIDVKFHETIQRVEPLYQLRPRGIEDLNAGAVEMRILGEMAAEGAGTRLTMEQP